VAYHRPVYSLDQPDAATDFSAYWQLMASHHVALVVDGHSHNYQRWMPLDGNGNPSPTGTTEIISGTGGQWISPFDHVDSRVAAGFDTTATAWGAVKLQLNPNGATYSFVNVSGQTQDYASSSCGPDSVAPSAPTGVQATVVSGREVAPELGGGDGQRRSGLVRSPTQRSTDRHVAGRRHGFPGHLRSRVNLHVVLPRRYRRSRQQVRRINTGCRCPPQRQRPPTSSPG